MLSYILFSQKHRIFSIEVHLEPNQKFKKEFFVKIYS